MQDRLEVVRFGYFGFVKMVSVTVGAEKGKSPDLTGLSSTSHHRGFPSPPVGSDVHRGQGQHVRSESGAERFRRRRLPRCWEGRGELVELRDWSSYHTID